MSRRDRNNRNTNRVNRNSRVVEEPKEENVEQEVTETVETQEEVKHNVMEATEPNPAVEAKEEIQEDDKADKTEENTTPEEIAEEPKETLPEEVVGEPKEIKEPTPVKEEKPEEAKPNIGNSERQKLNLQDVQRLLKDKSKTIEEKLDLIAKTAVPELRTIASAITTYHKAVSPKNGFVEPKFVASKNQVLLASIKRVLEVKGDNAETKFKTMFDIINLGFLIHKKDSFSPLNLHRGDMYWTDRKELNTFNLLTVIISDLCSLATRQEKLKKLDINKALTVKDTSLSERAINRIKAYYKA